MNKSYPNPHFIDVVIEIQFIIQFTQVRAKIPIQNT